MEIAELLFRELLASSEAPVLLHGDLHHFNILSSDRRPWVAIDPKGLSGEPLTKLARCYVNVPSTRDWKPSFSSIVITGSNPP